jgi:hypothetical protein
VSNRRSAENRIPLLSKESGRAINKKVRLLEGAPGGGRSPRKPNRGSHQVWFKYRFCMRRSSDHDRHIAQTGGDYAAKPPQRAHSAGGEHAQGR